MLVISSGDSVVVKYHHVDRQRGPRNESHYRIANGVVLAGATWNLPLYGGDTLPLGAPIDRFTVDGGNIKWQVSPVSDEMRTSAFTRGASFYRLRGNTPYDTYLLARHLMRQTGMTSEVLPAGTGRAEVVASTSRTRSGKRETFRFVVVGPPNSVNPAGVWIDADNRLISGQVSWFIAVRTGYESLLPEFRRLELAYRDKAAEALAQRVAPAAASAVAIINGDVFDSDRGVMRPRTTVLIRGDRIVAVGPSDSFAVPAGAKVIDAAGKTVMPGMWDVHNHFQVASQLTLGVAQLANGITTVRDVAADMDVAVSLRDRASAGKLAIPRSVLGGFLEGPGRWAGPSEAIVSTEAEARAWIARYDSAGYKQIKLYNLIQQDLVPAIADETHKRGMRLSGHVPRGLSTPAAVRLGFDEINHAAFLFSTFYPESLYIPVMRAYSAVSQIVAPNVDVDGPEMTAMIQLLKEKGTVIDGTWNLWLSAPNAVSTAVGIPNAPNVDAAQKADANYIKLLKRLFDAGVTIIPGTDGSSYNVELELYERAGIPAPEVLRIATIVPARVMGDDKDYGSIAVGKVADIAIVDGKPAERISDLRRVERVLRAGRLYESSALRAAIR
jgi:hypothetical protein